MSSMIRNKVLFRKIGKSRHFRHINHECFWVQPLAQRFLKVMLSYQRKCQHGWWRKQRKYDWQFDETQQILNKMVATKFYKLDNN